MFAGLIRKPVTRTLYQQVLLFWLKKKKKRKKKMKRLLALLVVAGVSLADGPRPPGSNPDPVFEGTGESYTLTDDFGSFVNLRAALTISVQHPPTHENMTFTVVVHVQRDGVVGESTFTYNIVTIYNEATDTSTGSGSLEFTQPKPGGWFIYQVVSYGGVVQFTTAGDYIP
jgi:hypothetical protein